MPERYKAAFRNHPARAAIITADDSAGPVGLTATSVISLSAEPSLLAFSLSGDSSTAPRIARADSVVVHLLTVGQVDLAKRFATSGIDRFADGVSWSRLETGEPFLSGAQCWLRGRIVRQYTVGNATLVVVDVLEAEPGSASCTPLVYQNRTWYALDETAVVA